MDYAAIAQQRLTGEFQDSPKLKALVAAMVGPLTDIETESEALRTERWIDTAIGVQLDGCGAIVGEARLGRTDDEYRRAIKYRVFVNTSTGTPRDVIYGLRYLTQPTDCQYLEAYPATAILFTDGYFVPEDIKSQMQDLAPVAISDVPVCVTFAGRPLRFSSMPMPSELFVNDDYLTVQGSDLQVSTGAALATDDQYALGGCVPADLSLGGELYLELDSGATLAVYDPNRLVTLGHDNLTGVYQ